MAEQLFKKNCDRDISLYLFTSLASVTHDQKTWSEFNSIFLEQQTSRTHAIWKEFNAWNEDSIKQNNKYR